MTNINENKYQNYLLVSFVFMFSGMMAAINQFKLPMIMTDVAKSFNMPMSQAVWMMSIFTFVGIFLALPAGSFAQKWGPKNMVILAALFVAGGSILGSMASSGGMMIFSRGLEGVGFIFVTVCGPMAIGKYVEPSKIGSAMGIWAVWVCIGQVIANNLTPPLYTAIGFRGVWLVYAIITLVMAAGVIFLIKTPKELEADQAEQSSVKISEAFRNKNLWFLCLSFLIFNAILMAVLVFAPTFLTSNGVSVTTAGFATSIPMLLALVSSPIFGKLSDIIGSRKKLYLIALMAMGIGSGMMFSSTGAVMYVGAVILGLVGLGTPAMALSSIGEIVQKPELAGMGMGLIMTCQGVGMFVGSMIMPYLLKLTGENWTTAGWILLPIALVSVIIAAMAKFK
ncbi:MAG TPA: MFS transporter [Syntrophomonadaceae bacterium]|nr:MFS transporter [Syntrophomonadaceae bacterium]